MSTTSVFGLDTIVSGITRTNTCNKYVNVEILVINNKLFLVNEECPEGSGTCTLVLVDISSGTPKKTTLANGSGYNRTNLIGIRVMLGKTILVGNGYGEAFGNSQCPEKGDLWLISGTTPHHLCSPYSNTGGGNIYNPLLDGKLGYIITGGTGAGWYIQKWDYKNFKYVDSWEVADPSNGLWHDELFYDNDTDTYYLLLAGKNKTNPTVKVYKIPGSVLRDSWKSTQYLINASGVELLVDTQYNIWEARSTMVFNGCILSLLDINGNATSTLICKDGSMQQLSVGPHNNVLSGIYLLVADTTNNVVNIYDTSLNKIDSVNFDFSTYGLVGNSGSDEWITTKWNKSNGSYDIIGWTYNEHIPYLEIDPDNGTVSLKDFKTGELLKGTLIYYETDVVTGQLPPLGSYKTLTINGTANIPSSSKKFIQFYVKSISGLAG